MVSKVALVPSSWDLQSGRAGVTIRIARAQSYLCKPGDTITTLALLIDYYGFSFLCNFDSESVKHSLGHFEPNNTGLGPRYAKMDKTLFLP
ncbi:Zonadhesin [Manis pentadactyla]|nr:Zonadhesin [Manis pentadactyla]